MGLSSNQARFLSLTSRQVDLEHRIQQICQRRLRLSSELENVATSYNNNISNRKMFTPAPSGLNTLSINTLKTLGYRVINAENKTLTNTPLRAINQLSEAEALSQNYVTIHNAQEFQNALNSATAGQKFMLQGDIDLSKLGPLTTAVVTNDFQGTFDGNGYVLRNLNIDTSASTSNLGVFSTMTNATIRNVAIENASVNASNSGGVGILAGVMTDSNVYNSYTTGDVTGNNLAGGLVGVSSGASNITYSYTEANVTGNYAIGGFAGAARGNISECYSTGDVTNTHAWTTNPTNNGNDTGSFVGNNYMSTITNSYSTGNLNGAYANTGGFVGYNKASTITNSYTTGHISSIWGYGGFVGNNTFGATDDSTNFYLAANAGGDPGGATTNQAAATAGWLATGQWDMSKSLPTLISTGDISAQRLEEGLRNGRYSLAKTADEYTQDPLDINGDKYQEVDWRSTPEIYDELYKGDDVAAENKYDKTIEEINAQDKKLQLEQTTIEVEYKAISSEKEAVKKILDTNASSSFKYFS